MILLPLCLQLIGLGFAVLIDDSVRREHRRAMLSIVALVGCLVVQNVFGYLLDEQGTRHYARTLVAIFGYSIRPLILLMFFYIVGPKRSHRLAWILVGFNFAVHLTACFSGLCFWIDESFAFHRGPLGYTCHIVSAVMLLELARKTKHEYVADKAERKHELWIPLLNVVLIVAAVIVDSFSDYHKMPVTYLTVAVVSSSLFYYVWLHLQFVRKHEQALMAEQRLQIMMTQIQPHFLYNTLSTIHALCLVNPQKAAEITGKFSAYMRQNLNSLEFTGIVSFDKELEHTRTYSDIEMIRFPNIRVEYEIEDAAFSIPPLTVQPMVENAIRHGVRIREEGLVRVSARKTEDGHEIVIRDNGIGFDAEAFAQSDGTHVGIRNVRERIESMCGGSLQIDSRHDEGTTVTIRIPDGEKGKGKCV